MSSTLSIELPSPETPVIAGTAGAVKVVVRPGPMSFPGSVQSQIHDPSGNAIWSDKADVSSDVATLALRWPAAPGIHTVFATCFGLSGLLLASASQQFTVLPAPKPS